MSVEALKEEPAGLDTERRNEIVAYLLSIDDQKNAEYLSSLARKIDDKNPAHWLTLEEMDRRLSITDDERLN